MGRQVVLCLAPLPLSLRFLLACVWPQSRVISPPLWLLTRQQPRVDVAVGRPSVRARVWAPSAPRLPPHATNTHLLIATTDARAGGASWPRVISCACESPLLMSNSVCLQSADKSGSGTRGLARRSAPGRGKHIHYICN